MRFERPATYVLEYSMRLYLCEKPSQAKDLAASIGANVLKSDHLTIDDGVITWASGHLLELPKPDEIHPKYRKWDPADLPILPKHFNWKPREKTKDQLDAIGRLLKKADVVIIATDAEREGELIARLILDHHNYTGPLQRLWLKALDPVSIKKALDSPLPGDEKYPLYQSALLRAKSDWLVGMNASRAASAQMGGPGRPVSIGRVQTPTLALLVQRDKEIASFKPATYPELTAEVISSNGVPITLKYPSTNEEEVRKAFEAINGATTSDLVIKEEDISEAPPELFNLSGLQQKTSLIWGWTASHTLKLVQRLYEHHKVVSYPRSDATQLPDEQRVQIPQVLAAIQGSVLASKVPEHPVIRDSVFVKDLDSAHNAIVPTTQVPNFNELSPDERKAYLLISKSYLAGLYPDYKAKKVSYETTVNGHKLIGEAVRTTSLGWKVLSKVPEQGPIVESGPAQFKPTIKNLETSAPEHYTDGTLIGDMTSVKKFISNPKILDVLQDKASLGTEATRASIIDELVASEFVKRDGTSLVCDPKSIELVDKLKEYAPLLVDPAETAIWEDGLKRIEKGTLTPEKFMEGIEKRVNSHVSKLLTIPRSQTQAKDVTCGKPIDFLCPLSQLPARDLGKGWVFPGYGEVFCPKILAGVEMHPEDYTDIFKGEFVPRDFVSKAGKPFFAQLVYNPKANKIEFDFSVEPPFSDMGP